MKLVKIISTAVFCILAGCSMNYVNRLNSNQSYYNAKDEHLSLNHIKTMATYSMKSLNHADTTNAIKWANEGKQEINYFFGDNTERLDELRQCDPYFNLAEQQIQFILGIKQNK
jgi:hypothetical protein